MEVILEDAELSFPVSTFILVEPLIQGPNTLRAGSVMALKLGIGDVFTICKGAMDLYSTVPRIHEEFQEVQSLVAEIKLMKSHLKTLEAQVGDEKSFV